ncbi:MAG: hypothetical protein WC601_11545 [Desulfotomaculaceae bacterium]
MQQSQSQIIRRPKSAISELLINTHAHVNLAIIYSFTGNFAMAKQVLDTHLLLLYCGVLVYAV